MMMSTEQFSIAVERSSTSNLIGFNKYHMPIDSHNWPKLFLDYNGPQFKILNDNRLSNSEKNDKFSQFCRTTSQYYAMNGEVLSCIFEKFPRVKFNLDILACDQAIRALFLQSFLNQAFDVYIAGGFFTDYINAINMKCFFFEKSIDFFVTNLSPIRCNEEFLRMAINFQNVITINRITLNENVDWDILIGYFILNKKIVQFKLFLVSSTMSSIANTFFVDPAKIIYSNSTKQIYFNSWFISKYVMFNMPFTNQGHLNYIHVIRYFLKGFVPNTKLGIFNNVRVKYLFNRRTNDRIILLNNKFKTERSTDSNNQNNKMIVGRKVLMIE